MIKTPLKRSTHVSMGSKQGSTQNSQRAEHTNRARTDVSTRAVVDKAIELESLLGPVVAAGLLKTRHVPFNVAERVLLHPEQRRKA